MATQRGWDFGAQSEWHEKSLEDSEQRTGVAGSPFQQDPLCYVCGGPHGATLAGRPARGAGGLVQGGRGGYGKKGLDKHIGNRDDQLHPEQFVFSPILMMKERRQIKKCAQGHRAVPI